MCGINGILNFEQAGPYLQQTQQMNKALAHRGPDDEGLYSDSFATLGHRRLSIIDTSTGGHQPMISADKRYVIVFNGEIYNYANLKASFQESYHFQTGSDTEVILAGYIRYGTELFGMLKGIFALAIWDISAKKLVLARDHLGVKPVYFARTGQTFIFSSELRSLLASNFIPARINQNSLADYMRYQRVHAPYTMVEGVSILQPGTYMTITESETDEKQYYSTRKIEFAQEIDHGNVLKNIRQLLSKSVEEQLVADVEVGAFLSGGIDSSVIVALMSETASRPVNTFSITFGQQDFDESYFSGLVSKKFKTNHCTIQLNPLDLLEALPHALNAMDHPTADGINTYLVSGKTREQGIKVALSGLGGDELFGGYPVFKVADQMSQFGIFSRMLPDVFWKKIFSTIYAITGKNYLLKISESFTEYDFIKSFLVASRQTYFDSQIKRLLPAIKMEKNLLQESIACDIYTDSKHLYSLVSSFELNSYLTDTLLRDTDQMSMAHALEVRVPFLDHTLVKYVLSLPDEIKKGRYSKNLLIDSMKDLLPPEVYTRKKMGFVFPWELWMRNELNSFCSERMSSFAARPFANEENINRLWQQFTNGNSRVNWSRIWQIVVLEEWLSKNNIVE
ncbi:MAG: asparagine synthase (glutamine-hydrolyzing) [Bacteroidia bacterium]|nr:asparagine synthase (glutamine-hydrolyzing) [Bacteroidia bacterium]